MSGNIEDATTVVREYLRGRGTIVTEGRLVADIVSALNDEVSPALVAAALKQLVCDKRIEIAQTRGVYDSVIYLDDVDPAPSQPEEESIMTQSRSASVVDAGEVKRAYDELYDAAEEGGVLELTSCTDYIDAQMNLPKGRARTINALLAKIGLRRSQNIGGGRCAHWVLEHGNRASLEEISERLERHRIAERNKHRKTTDLQTEQLPLPKAEPVKPVSPEIPVAESIVPIVSEPDVPAMAPLPDPDESELSNSDAIVLYLLLNLSQAIGSKDLARLGKKLRPQLQASERRQLGHFFIEMFSPE